MPIEPPPCRWEFPVPGDDTPDLVAVGADLEPATLLAAYRRGLFPMPVGPDGAGPLGWWSPEPRAILPPESLQISRSLRASCRRYRLTVDQAFDDVIDHCRTLPRPGGWISSDIRDAYVRLHRLGWAHSVETWSGGQLVGGLYGVAIGVLFAGESMFHLAPDASKVALVHLVSLLGDANNPLLDVQWATEHLVSLGAVTIPRAAYLERVARAVGGAPFAAFATS